MRYLIFIMLFLASCETEQKESDNAEIQKDNQVQPKKEKAIKGQEVIPIGIGLTKIRFNYETLLVFQSDTTDESTKRTMEFFKGESGYDIHDWPKIREWLKPEIFTTDYGSFHFRCLEVTEGWFKVIVNNEDGNVLWLKRNDDTFLITWTEFLADMFLVERVNKNEKIRSSASDKSEEIPYEDHDCFKTKTIQGDWIEIYSPGMCNSLFDQDIKVIESGWIKWRDGDTLLIKYSLIS